MSTGVGHELVPVDLELSLFADEDRSTHGTGSWKLKKDLSSIGVGGNDVPILSRS